MIRTAPRPLEVLTETAAKAQVSDVHHVGRPPRTFQRSEPAVIGLYLAHGRVGADVIPDSKAEPIRRVLRSRGGRQLSRQLRLHTYAAVVYRGRFYRLATAADDAVGFGRIEGFWGYLGRQLRAKGGIRRERLPLYVAEYVWHYNRRGVSPAEQVRELFKLIREQTAGGSSRTLTGHKTPARIAGILPSRL